MKGLLTVLIWWSAATLNAQSVTLAWDVSPSPEVVGYRVYFGTNAGSYVFSTNAGLSLTQAVVLPHTGRWFFAATAVDSLGTESDFSNMVEWEAKPAAPVVHDEKWLRLSPLMGRSTNQVDWMSFPGAVTWIRATNAMEFFALKQLVIEEVRRVDEP